MLVIHVARKPLSESSVAANVLKHGTGAINIDGCRIESDGSHMVPHPVTRGHNTLMSDRTAKKDGPGMFTPGCSFIPTNHPGGRWPTNLVLQHLPGCRCVGTKSVKAITGGMTPGSTGAFGKQGVYGTANGLQQKVEYGNKDGTETIEAWACESGCPVADLDDQSGERKTTWVSGSHANNRSGEFMGALGHPGEQGYNDTGGASRFFKQVGGTGKAPEG